MKINDRRNYTDFQKIIINPRKEQKNVKTEEDTFNRHGCKLFVKDFKQYQQEQAESDINLTLLKMTTSLNALITVNSYMIIKNTMQTPKN